MSDTESPKPKRAHRDLEGPLQVQINKFVRNAVTGSPVFLSFDRSASQSKFQHARESARGIRRGTPDTLLMCNNLPDFFCELKVAPNAPDASQVECLDDIRRVGRNAAVAYSVTEYFEAAQKFGVPMTHGAAVLALQLDALIQSARARTEPQKKATRSKPREDRPTLGTVRRVEAMRRRTPF